MYVSRFISLASCSSVCYPEKCIHLSKHVYLGTVQTFMFLIMNHLIGRGKCGNVAIED